jgi:hypothetical protein
MPRLVAAVDAEDDLIRRYVVWWYAYDSERHERRNQVVTAVDNKREFEFLITSLSAELQGRRAAGEAIDPREHYSGTVFEPGHLGRQKNKHLLKRAMKEAQKHGTPIPGALLELPSGAGVVRAEPLNGTEGDAEAPERHRRDVGGGTSA